MPRPLPAPLPAPSPAPLPAPSPAPLPAPSPAPALPAAARAALPEGMGFPAAERAMLVAGAAALSSPAFCVMGQPGPTPAAAQRGAALLLPEGWADRPGAPSVWRLRIPEVSRHRVTRLFHWFARAALHQGLTDWAAARLGLIEEAEAEGSRGRMGWASRTRSRLPAGRTDVENVPFYGRCSAEVAVAGDGNTNLDVLTTDENGNTICHGESWSDRVYCDFTPRWNGYFSITFQNVGRKRSSDYLLTNRALPGRSHPAPRSRGTAHNDPAASTMNAAPASPRAA